MEKLNVAIADDNVRMADILGQMIEEDKDLTLVGKAHNGEEICSIIREKEPDVVVLDIIMPKMDGLQLLEKLQKDKIKATVIMVSTLTTRDAQTTILAMERGAVDFVPKPSNIIEAKGNPFLSLIHI